MGEKTNTIKGLVSVIIVTFKRLEYLKETIDSVLNQTYKNIEVIVVSDGYEKDVEEYVKILFDQGYSIQYDSTEHCGYPARPRNLALSKCIGEYVAFLDDDDLWERDKLRKQYLFLENNPSFILCATNRRSIGSDNQMINSRRIKWLPRSNFNWVIFLTNYITYSSVMTKKAKVVEIGGFKDDILFRAVEDYHLWLRLSQEGKFNVLQTVETYYRIHNSNISRSLLEGNKKLVLVFRDVFSILKTTFSLRIMSYAIIYLKIIYYKAFGK